MQFNHKVQRDRRNFKLFLATTFGTLGAGGAGTLAFLCVLGLVSGLALGAIAPYVIAGLSALAIGAIGIFGVYHLVKAFNASVDDKELSSPETIRSKLLAFAAMHPAMMGMIIIGFGMMLGFTSPWTFGLAAVLGPLMAFSTMNMLEKFWHPEEKLSETVAPALTMKWWKEAMQKGKQSVKKDPVSTSDNTFASSDNNPPVIHSPVGGSGTPTSEQKESPKESPNGGSEKNRL